MVKKAILLLSAIAGIGVSVKAQNHCATDEVNARAKVYAPQIAEYEVQMERQIQEILKGGNLSRFARVTNDDTVYHVPIVFHIIHDYGVYNYPGGNDYVTDNQIYAALDNINTMYAKRNADTSTVIGPYKGTIPGSGKRYIGKANIVFHLPTKDPDGKPTKGITRTRTYLTNSGGDQAKLEQWPPDSYLNIWLIYQFDGSHAGAAAYAYKPASAAFFPFNQYDGVISAGKGQGFNADNTLAHELGHSLNLDHPFGMTNGDGSNTPFPWYISTCGDDNVDDTPPTKGHTPSAGCTAPALYDTVCLSFFDTLAKRTMFQAPTISTINYKGIDFVTKVPLTIKTVDIYPDTIGKPFTIELRRYGNVYNGQSYTGVTSAIGKQTVTLNFTAAADSGYTLILNQNPGVLQDAAVMGSYPRVIGNNRVYFKADTASGRYNYLYNWQVTYSANDTPATIGKPGLTVSTDTITGKGFTFLSPTRSMINWVDIYPTDTVGAPFSINLSQVTVNRNNQVVSSGIIGTYNGTVTSRYRKQSVQVNFTIPASDTSGFSQGLANKTSYTVSFGQNPKAITEPVAGAYPTPSSFIKGSVSYTKDTIGANYNYFYNVTVKYYYFKYYTAIVDSVTTRDSLVDYPDTVNAQNIMDYTYCSKMFTYGQTTRMRAALNSSTAGRSNLITAANLAATGALESIDLAPIADFSVSRFQEGGDKLFGCADQVTFNFTDRSWRDTIDSRAWTFSNGATNATATTNTVANKFSEPGWATVTLTANSNAGSGTVSKTNVYVADPNAVSALGYFQEFNNTGDYNKWPIFNYYNNTPKWEVINNNGYYDNSCIVYHNYDTRAFPDPTVLKGTWKGDIDDFYSIALDLSSPEYATNCNLNFMTSGAFRSSVPSDMNDTLEVWMSIDCGNTFTRIATIGKYNLANKGVVDIPYAPLWQGDWKMQSISIPSSGRKSKVFFRFRYKPGVFTANANFISSNSFNMVGSGNNFYLDRINISSYPVGVSEVELDKNGIVLAPNPTTGGSSILIKGGNDDAQVAVLDITGKTVYRTKQQLNGGLTQIEIPASYISVKGMYLVQVVTGHRTFTEKLVVQ